jgi:hypothetical protein
MPERIGPKRLLRLLDQEIDLYTLPPQQQFEAFHTMARLLTQPPGCTPKRRRPRCGARCRNGRRCQAPVVWEDAYDAPRNGRCRLHGGLSTGPRTPEGRQRIGEAARQRAQARRQAAVQAAAQASALAAYQAALAKYAALCQHDMSAFPGLKDAMRQVQGYAVARSYQACLACGVNPRAGEEP